MHLACMTVIVFFVFPTECHNIRAIFDIRVCRREWQKYLSVLLSLLVVVVVEHVGAKTHCVHSDYGS